MKLNVKDLEAILISKASALVFALLGVSLGSFAYFKFKAPVAEQADSQREIVDTRDPVEVDRESRLKRASALIERKLYKSAEEILRGLLKETPKNPYVLSMMSLCLKKMGRLENAELVLRGALALEPGQWALHNNLGMLLFDKGKPMDALESFNKALELSPKNYRVLLSKGRVQELIGKFTDARLSYGRAVESGQMDPATSTMVRERLKKLDVLAYIERGDK